MQTLINLLALTLCLSTTAAGESAPPSPSHPATPSVTELEHQRPNPERVRGCTMPNGSTQNFTDLKAWRANVVRKWIDLKPDSYQSGVASYRDGWERQLAPIETFLAHARAAGIMVVLTTNGSTFMENDKQWGRPGLGAAVAAVWRGIAQHLEPYRDVIYGYDLFNEPLDWEQMPKPPRQWYGIAADTVAAIRATDHDTWIVYEAGPGSLCWGFAGLTPLPDTHVIYSGHAYNPQEFTHQGVYDLTGTDLAEVQAKTGVHYPGDIKGVAWNKDQLRHEMVPLRDFQLRYHVPILIGEFSVIRWAPTSDAAQYLTDLTALFEEYHWSWIYHAFREWHGWSLEHDETFAQHDVPVPPTPHETDRARVIKAGLALNGP